MGTRWCYHDRDRVSPGRRLTQKVPFTYYCSSRFPGPVRRNPVRCSTAPTWEDSESQVSRPTLVAEDAGRARRSCPARTYSNELEQLADVARRPPSSCQHSDDSNDHLLRTASHTNDEPGLNSTTAIVPQNLVDRPVVGCSLPVPDTRIPSFSRHHARWRSPTPRCNSPRPARPEACHQSVKVHESTKRAMPLNLPCPDCAPAPPKQGVGGVGGVLQADKDCDGAGDPLEADKP